MKAVGVCKTHSRKSEKDCVLVCERETFKNTR